MIIFFEIDKVNVERYYFNRLEKNFKSEKVVVVLEDPIQLKIFRNKYPKIKSFQFLDWIKGVSKKYKNSNVFINGNRIPDLLMAKVSNENDCKVIFIQHGMFVEFMKRDTSLFLMNMKKALRYAYYAILLRKAISLFKIHLLGFSRVLTSDRKDFYPHHAFVFNEYWKEWHNKNYFFNQTKIFSLLKNNDTEQNVIRLNNTVVYCYQTLVEDGRIDINYFKEVMNKIIQSVKASGLNFVVKGHPRMSDSTTDYFKEICVEVIQSGFICGGIVVGHYSSLLARWVYEGDALIIVELEGHNIPEPVKKLATIICYPENLAEDLKKLDYSKSEYLRSKSDFYFNFAGKNSVETISDLLALVKN